MAPGGWGGEGREGVVGIMRFVWMSEMRALHLGPHG